MYDLNKTIYIDYLGPRGEIYKSLPSDPKSVSI